MMTSNGASPALPSLSPPPIYAPPILDSKQKAGAGAIPLIPILSPIETLEKIAIWKASNMPIQYHIIRCRKEGEVRFTMGGAEIFLSVLISNVADSGDIAAVKIKGSKMQWLPMREESGDKPGI
ncbi:hypothetical protein ACS0TY_001703 [Phlomoides rotata]